MARGWDGREKGRFVRWRAFRHFLKHNDYLNIFKFNQKICAYYRWLQLWESSQQLDFNNILEFFGFGSNLPQKAPQERSTAHVLISNNYFI